MTQTEEKIYLKDIGGYEEEKEEARKIINLMKNAKEYMEMGVNIPKGLILSGNPGVGKTMFAKAIANESNVPFFILNVDYDDESSNKAKIIKETFQKAKEEAPSIIFIDEISELVTVPDFISDQTRTVLKTFLTEMDGASSSSGVLVIATTSVASILPIPLIRSGRMDKRINFEEPDLEDRKEIAEIYLSISELTKDLDPQEIALKTGGFTGADIKNLVNEAMLLAVSENRSSVSKEDIEKALPPIRFKGIKKKSDPESDKPVAYHELGHAICMRETLKKLPSISIIKYGEVRGHIISENEYGEKLLQKSMTREEMFSRIVIALGGMASEEVFLGTRSTGCSEDILKATSIIQAMFVSGLLGFEYLQAASQDSSPFLNPLSESMLAIREKKQTEILDEAMGKAKEMIEKNKDLIEYLADILIERKSLDKREVKELVVSYEKNRKEHEQ